jgi:hypothetical protein
MGPEAAAATTAATPASTTTAEPSNDELASILTGKSQKPVAEAADDAGEDDDEDLDAEDNDGAEPEPKKRPEAKQETGEAADETETETEDDQDNAGEETDDKAPDPDTELDEATKAARAKFTPEQQKLFDKAVSKKTRRIIELRTEAQTLKQTLEQRDTELEEARNAQPVASLAPTADNPLSGINDETALGAKVASMRALRSWARRNPQGGVLKNGDKEIEISAERAAEMLDEAESVIEAAEPRRKFLQARATAHVEAVKAYPWLKDKRSPATVVVQDIMRRRPQLTELFPDVEIALADMIVGAHQRNSQAQTKGAATKAAPDKTKTAPKAPSTPAGGARPPKVSTTAKAATGATQVLEKTGEDPGNATLSSLLR